MPTQSPPEAAAAAPEAVAALLDFKDPFRANGDLEIDIPLHAIDPAPFNPKTPIAGPYKRGLIGSLAEFGLRDRLKVWPKPREAGRYLALDGNQRLTVLREMAEDYFASIEASARLAAEHAGAAGAIVVPEAPPAWLDLDSKDGRKRLKATFEAVQADATFMGTCRARANSLAVPCRVLSDMDRADAELFTASFDRSHAKFDEGKQAALVDRSLAAKEALGTLRESARKRFEAMTRPERAFVAPPVAAPVAPPPAPIVADAVAAAGPAPPPVDADGDEMPWGPLPPPEPEAGVAPGRPALPPQPPLVPMMFSLTAQAHAELTRGILTSTQRMVRSTRLIEAVTRFVDCSTEADLSEAAVEVALVCLERRLAVAQAEDAASL